MVDITTVNLTAAEGDIKVQPEGDTPLIKTEEEAIKLMAHSHIYTTQRRPFQRQRGFIRKNHKIVLQLQENYSLLGPMLE